MGAVCSPGQKLDCLKQSSLQGLGMKDNGACVLAITYRAPALNRKKLRVNILAIHLSQVPCAQLSAAGFGPPTSVVRAQSSALSPWTSDVRL
jgi:hypothetical protein